MKSRKFRSALGKFPTGVVVATARTRVSLASFRSDAVDLADRSVSSARNSGTSRSAGSLLSIPHHVLAIAVAINKNAANIQLCVEMIPKTVMGVLCSTTTTVPKKRERPAAERNLLINEGKIDGGLTKAAAFGPPDGGRFNFISTGEPFHLPRNSNATPSVATGSAERPRQSDGS